jgi:hypothetical protein
LSDVLKDHLSAIQIKLKPRGAYTCLSFSSVFLMLIFFDILDSIVSIFKGSAAAKIIA